MPSIQPDSGQLQRAIDFHLQDLPKISLELSEISLKLGLAGFPSFGGTHGYIEPSRLEERMDEVIESVGQIQGLNDAQGEAVIFMAESVKQRSSELSSSLIPFPELGIAGLSDGAAFWMAIAISRAAVEKLLPEERGESVEGLRNALERIIVEQLRNGSSPSD